jgi:hypothetical protein
MIAEIETHLIIGNAGARPPESVSIYQIDIHTLGTWPERGLPGTQLGRNRSGKS